MNACSPTMTARFSAAGNTILNHRRGEMRTAKGTYTPSSLAFAILKALIGTGAALPPDEVKVVIAKAGANLSPAQSVALAKGALRTAGSDLRINLDRSRGWEIVSPTPGVLFFADTKSQWVELKAYMWRSAAPEISEELSEA